MTTTYAAHIITTEAEALGDPEIVIMTAENEDTTAEFIARYPLHSSAPNEVLTGEGWRISGEPQPVETGYFIVDVEPANWEAILTYVTLDKKRAEFDLEQQDAAWRTVIRDAMLTGGSATKLANAASISRERVYQIRDGRR